MIEALLTDASPLVRAMAVWALGRLLPEARFSDLAKDLSEGEEDPDVRAEWLKRKSVFSGASRPVGK